MDQNLKVSFVKILQEELVPALGCTEPIAVAFAAARARDALGTFPQRITAYCSGNIVKNVKAVTVPNSNGLRGIEAAATLGAVGGQADMMLEVLSAVTQEQIDRTRQLLRENFCRTELASGVDKLYVKILAENGNDSAYVVIQGQHTNITDVVKNGQAIFHKEHIPGADVSGKEDRSGLSVENILEFADEVAVEALEPILSRQVEYNTRIAEAGMSMAYGVGVTKTLKECGGAPDFAEARLKAVAASEARMVGCPLPVVINSGSGNQGITASVPVVEYAATHGVDRERMYRALAVSNLVSIHLKSFIGDLSAFCGAVTAACGVAAALAYMESGDYEVVSDSISNTLAAVSGIFCDGAKPSCAAKVAAALESAYLSFRMAKSDHAYGSGEGVVGVDIEQTARGVGHIGRVGMEVTDQEILQIMMQNPNPPQV